MISIIVPIYGVEKYIRQCIESIINQTYTDIEIILVDDGSKDNCPSICDEYAVQDSRIKVIHKKNGGLVSARQAGLKAASGEYVGFVDGDDYIEINMYMKIYKSIEKYNPDMIACEYFCDYSDSTDISRQCFSKDFYNKSDLEKEIYPIMLYEGEFYSFGISPGCWSKVFKREILENNLYKVDTRIKMGEDAAFTYPCMLDARNVCCIKEPLYHYRIVTGSMSRGYDENLENVIYLPYKRLCEKNRESSFDISSQLSYYMIYMANFSLRNMAKAFGNIKKETKILFINQFLENDELKRCAKTINIKKLPMHTRFIVKCIQKKYSKRLYMYLKLLSLHLK